VFDSTVGRLRLLRVKAETYLEEAITEAERLMRLEGRDPAVTDELARLYARAGRRVDAERAAALTISRAVAAGQGALASDVVRRFGELHGTLSMRPGLLDQLGWALVQQGDFEGASWAFEALKIASGGTLADPERVQKGLVAVADAAAAA